MSNSKGPGDAVQKRTKPSEMDPIPKEKLPENLQKLVDNEESLMDQIYDGTANESTESNLRYAAYANRLRTIMLSAHRYVAYTSDIGESFRPIAHPWLIRSAYGISWAYLIGDVGHEGYKSYLRNQRIKHPGEPGVMSMRTADGREPLTTENVRPEVGHVPAIEDFRSVMVQRAVFQSLASMGLPAFTIHSIVRYSGRTLKNAKNTTVRTYGPIGLGLAAVPFLPFLFDKPVEEAVEWTFHKAFETFGGPNAVAHTSETGRVTRLPEKSRKGSSKEKEL
ncbi:hypothetical protein MMC28_006150 [Mycoblastus sanguinarius]|nr:hypothetical protein [Mycoblastus sanguinarius]